MNDLQLAVAVLVDGGLSPEEAKRQLVDRPQMIGELAGPIAAKRQEFEALAEQARAEAYAASPAGRAEAARNTAQAVKEREALVADARVLLGEEGNFSPDEIAGFDATQVLHYAHIDVQPSLLTSDQKDAAALRLAESGAWGRMSVQDRIQAGLDLGFTTDGMDSFVASITPTATEDDDDA